MTSNQEMSELLSVCPVTKYTDDVFFLTCIHLTCTNKRRIADNVIIHHNKPFLFRLFLVCYFIYIRTYFLAFFFDRFIFWYCST